MDVGKVVGLHADTNQQWQEQQLSTINHCRWHMNAENTALIWRAACSADLKCTDEAAQRDDIGGNSDRNKGCGPFPYRTENTSCERLAPTIAVHILRNVGLVRGRQKPIRLHSTWRAPGAPTDDGAAVLFSGKGWLLNSCERAQLSQMKQNAAACSLSLPEDVS